MATADRNGACGGLFRLPGRGWEEPGGTHGLARPQPHPPVVPVEGMDPQVTAANRCGEEGFALVLALLALMVLAAIATAAAVAAVGQLRAAGMAGRVMVLVLILGFLGSAACCLGGKQTQKGGCRHPGY